MKHLHRFVRRAAAFVLAAALCVCMLAPAASAATTMGGADTTLIPAEEENCLAWLFGTSDTITMPYLNIKGKGLQRNVTLNLVDCLVGITYTELGSIGSYVSASAAQQAWKAQAVPSIPIWNTTSSTAPLPMRSSTLRWIRSRPRHGKPSAGRWNR